jgi:glutamate--cysteine ligase
LPPDSEQVAAISSYIAHGIEHGCGDCLGLELEHFIVTAGDHQLVPYLADASSGRPGVATVLQRLADNYDECIYEPQADGRQALIGLSRPHANVTLEPGAQLEISIGPVLSLASLEGLYQAFREEIEPVLAELGLELMTCGYHPSACANEIPLIPKTRYRYMDEHFKSTGRHGLCMMRASASTQVSIDFASEADAVRKFRIANALGPLLAFITDNSPVFEGSPVGSGGQARSGLPVPKRMARTAIWDDVDPARSMTAPHTFDPQFGFDDYAATLLSSAAVFTVEQDEQGGKHSVYQGSRSFTEAFAGQQLSQQEVEHILSLFFFDTRFKTYLEIRMADSLPVEYALSFAALIKGVFYQAEALAYYEQALAQVDAPAIATAKATLARDGYAATIYDRPATAWLEELFTWAAGGLHDRDAAYLSPLADLAKQRRTLVG